MGRAPCCEKVGLRRGRWTAEEDEKLINYIKQHGEGSWRSLPKNAGLLRCGKSCRLRWINYLRTGLKRGNFTREEEETIIKLHVSLGNKWSLIASNLPGRTDNEVKNYWNSHLSRKIYCFRSSNGSIVSSSDMTKMASEGKKKGGRVSRAVAKKYNMHTISKTTTTSISSPKIGAISGIQEATAVENPEAKKEGELSVACKSEVPEFTAAENEAEACNNVVASVEESGKNHFKQMDIYYNEDERGTISSMHNNRCGGPASRPPQTIMASPEQLGGENAVLGPNEGLDDVKFLFERVLESELMDLGGEISVDSSQTEKEHMDPLSALINNANDSGLYECFSPMNSYFSHELVPRDTDYAVLGFGLWDGGDDIIWPWESLPEKQS